MFGMHDLDELILRVRSASARIYVFEAVRAYQAGAIRACIIATWIAVVFDVVEKLRELELTGDKNAMNTVREFERAHASGDVGAALKFESNILDIAAEQFELLGLQELQDLKRLREDRHRCAHPSMALEGIYNPSPEMARYHLRNAVEHLLRHPPVQGKAALDRLLEEVDSIYFPVAVNQAITHFKSGPLARPKESLVRNFVVVLLKKLLSIATAPKDWARYSSALGATWNIHRSRTESTLNEMLPRLVREKGDQELLPTLKFVGTYPEAWGYVSEDLQIKLGLFVENCDNANLGDTLQLAMRVPALKQQAVARVGDLNYQQLMALLLEPPILPEYIDRAVDLYVKAGSFDSANAIAKALVLPLRDELTKTHVERILRGISANSQLQGAFSTHTVLYSLVNAGIVPVTEFNELSRKYGVNFPEIVDDLDWPVSEGTE